MSATKSGDLREIAHQASRYLIGAFIALSVDATITSVAVKLGVPVLVARVLALLTGVTVTYAFNRRYTFSPATPASFLDWRRYAAGQVLGAALNFTISGALLYYSDRHTWQIWGTVLAGAGGASIFFGAQTTPRLILRHLYLHRYACAVIVVVAGASCACRRQCLGQGLLG